MWRAAYAGVAVVAILVSPLIFAGLLLAIPLCLLAELLWLLICYVARYTSCSTPRVLACCARSVCCNFPLSFQIFRVWVVVPGPGWWGVKEGLQSRARISGGLSFLRQLLFFHTLIWELSSRETTFSLHLHQSFLLASTF